MALDYKIYFSSNIKTEDLIIGSLKNFNVEIVKEDTEKTIDIDLWESLGFNVFIVKSYKGGFEIKNKIYQFNGRATIRFNKFYKEVELRYKNLFTMIRYLTEENKTENFLCAFNGEEIIALKDKEGLILNSNIGLSTEAHEIFIDIPYREEEFDSGDLNYL